MTAPAQQQAPNGYMQDGSQSGSVDTTRDDMLNAFDQNTTDLADNSAYYESARRPDAIGIAIPVAMQKLLAYVGYPRVYVDSISERLTLEGFRLGSADQADADLWDWWQANNLDVEAQLGFTESLVHGRSYVTVAAPDPAIDLFVDPKVPLIRVESASSLYAMIDPKTRGVKQAVRRVENADGTDTIAATLYLPMQTVSWEKDDKGDWQVIQQVPHNLGIVPVVPVPNRTLLSDLQGTSEITPELRSITDAAARILMDMQGAAELMGVPQRLLFGIDPRELGIDPDTGVSKFDAYMNRMLGFENPDGKAFQFSAAELRNFVDALDALDKKAAAYTGLPPQYLSYSSQNPASAEAIKSSESRLVKKCESKSRIFGGAWEQAMRIAYMVMKGAKLPPDYLRMESIWSDPSTPTYAAKADAASKLYANGAGVIPKERARIDMGYSVTEREEMTVWDQQEQTQLLQAFGGAGTPPGAGGPPAGGNPANPTATQTTTQTPPAATKTATASPPS